jgi:histidine phosphotransferase ChpT
MGGEDLELAQAVCTRLCHDLGGPTGALGGALEMLGEVPDEAVELARDAARIIECRVRFWRAAAGGASAELDLASLTQLGEGLTLGRRARLDLDGLEAGSQIPPEFAQPLLHAMLLGIEALPRGGVLNVSGNPASGFTLLPAGVGAAWPPGLPALIAGRAPPELTPRTVVLPLLAKTAAAAGLRLDLAMGAGAGPAPLLLTRAA